MNVVQSGLEDLVQDEDFAVASVDRYLLLVWRRRVTVAGARAANDAMTRLYARRPYSPLSFITLIEAGCSLNVPSEVRDIVSGMLKDHNYALAATAVAYERAGFVSAIVRSVITAINIASCAVFRSDVSDKLDDAVAFATHVLGESAQQPRLVEALNALRGPRVLPVPTSLGRETRRLMLR